MTLMQALSLVAFMRPALERNGIIKTRDGRIGSFRKVTTATTNTPDVFDVYVLADFPREDSGGQYTQREAVHFTEVLA
jgi:hypothetical protein